MSRGTLNDRTNDDDVSSPPSERLAVLADTQRGDGFVLNFHILLSAVKAIVLVVVVHAIQQQAAAKLDERQARARSYVRLKNNFIRHPTQATSVCHHHHSSDFRLVVRCFDVSDRAMLRFVGLGGECKGKWATLGIIGLQLIEAPFYFFPFLFYSPPNPFRSISIPKNHMP